MPKLMFVGLGECGKDEAALWFNQHTTLYCAGSTSRFLAPYVAAELGLGVDVAYEQRRQHRGVWYQVGRKLRLADPGVLVRKSLKSGDIVMGVRDIEEIDAARPLVDLILWIERDVPPDETVKFGPEVADLVISNNGTLPEFHARLRRLAAALGVLAE